MKISKLIYLFNILFVIQILKPYICYGFTRENGNTDSVEDIDEYLKKKDRNKKILISTAIIAGTLLTAAAIGGGLYFTRDKRKSIWSNDKLGDTAFEILMESELVASQKAVGCSGKSKAEKDKVINQKNIKSIINEEMDKHNVKFSSSQKREIYKFIPFISHIMKHNLKEYEKIYGNA
ncbi:early transcribed membrane protein [Plasmodium relictum]|uniref:Early transcribed membrane protein n=1 Tax=Plasmodium relictum TaxID=85471 RepID=A0A1J1GK86_PLARL|nr:early transcribed membrane protein [Plasmodium relictum]CRG84784.1 early transcribed membrane protein [Plasmodium relictum]